MTKKHYILGKIIVSAVLFFGIARGLPFVYGLNDDVMLKSLMSGSYSGYAEAHAVYMLYPLSALIAFCYRIVPSFSWLDLFFVGIMTFCFLKIGIAIVSRAKTNSFKILTSIIVIEVLIIYYLENYFMITYTEVAALVYGTGLFLFCMNEEKKTINEMLKTNSLSIALILLAFMIRKEVFYMFSPYLAVVALWKMVKKFSRTKNECKMSETASLFKKEKKRILFDIVKSYSAFVVSLFIGIIIILGLHGVMHQSEVWKSYEVYNKARTQLYDFTGIPIYEDNEEVYQDLGLTENDFLILKQYNILLNEDISTEIFDALSIQANNKSVEAISLTDQLKKAVEEYVYRTFNQLDWPKNYIAIGLYALVIVLIIWQRKWLELVPVLMLGLGRNMLWIYFILQGRYPPRITTSLYLVEALLLLAIIIKQKENRCRIDLEVRAQDKKQYEENKYTQELYEKEDRKRTSKEFILEKILFVFVIILLLPFAYQTITKVTQLANVKHSKNNEFSILENYCRERTENFYYLDVYSMVEYTGNLFEDSGAYENYALMGGWMLGTPILEEKLQKASDKSRFYIAKPSSEITNTIELVKVDTIKAGEKELFYVYKKR